MNLSFFLELFAAGVAGFGLILNGISLWKNANARYLSNLQGFTREIRGLWESDNFDKSYTNWGINILNALNKIAFLADKKKINSSLVGYFDNDFEYACGLLNLKEFQKYQKDVPNLNRWCEKYPDKVKNLSNTSYDKMSTVKKEPRK